MGRCRIRVTLYDHNVHDYQVRAQRGKNQARIVFRAQAGILLQKPGVLTDKWSMLFRSELTAHNAQEC